DLVVAVVEIEVEDGEALGRAADLLRRGIGLVLVERRPRAVDIGWRRIAREEDAARGVLPIAFEGLRLGAAAKQQNEESDSTECLHVSLLVNGILRANSCREEIIRRSHGRACAERLN